MRAPSPRRAAAAAVIARERRDGPAEALALPRAEPPHAEALVARGCGQGPAKAFPPTGTGP